VRRGGVLEQTVVGLKDALRPLVPDALQELGRVVELTRSVNSSVTGALTGWTSPNVSV
jgi:hypothetical protein